jgi:HSP20 family molecular chaperone IbpA
MRLRYRSVTYSVGGTPASRERHYRELREAMLRAGQQYGVQPVMPWRPPIDIHETPEAIQVKVELAGVREDHIEITLYDNALVIAGQRDDDIEQGAAVYYHEAQVRYGPFRAAILLPLPVDREAVEATYENGFLRVRLPKDQPKDQKAADVALKPSGRSAEAATSAPTNGSGNGTTLEGTHAAGEHTLYLTEAGEEARPAAGIAIIAVRRGTQTATTRGAATR